MSILALSPVAPEPPSPMVTSVTPTLDPSASGGGGGAITEVELQQQSPGPGSPTQGAPHLGRDPAHRSKKPPPLHTGADWKVVLHLPEIEKWLRATSDRVTQLTHSVGQDSDNRHVDAHLVQLKDICEDISDHVEQIHALLETEFSLKLLSYSVNIIVDIRSVQLLWHQLRVSVLVLKERLLQGLQDSNGNFTRQTDILQAFSQDQHQTRLDALTEVDDCGQLTIRCSQDYFSLDCGITAFELSDYSPGDEAEAPGAAGEGGLEDEGEGEGPSEGLQQDPDADAEPESEGSNKPLNINLCNSLPELTAPSEEEPERRHALTAAMSEGGAKRPLQGVSLSTETSPTQPSLPKRAALFSEGGGGGVETPRRPLLGLQLQAELSRSTPTLVDPPDRSKFWLELDSVYPENVSQSYESLQVMNSRNLQRDPESPRHPEGSPPPPQPSTEAGPSAAAADGPPPLRDAASEDGAWRQMERRRAETHAPSEGGSDSSLPSPMREQLLSSDLDASGEESDPRPPHHRAAVWIVKRPQQKQDAPVASKTSPEREHWYGSEEFLALPAQLRKTEMLAMKLESLTQSIPPRSAGSGSTEEPLQDVDDWELTELNGDWEAMESSDDDPSPPPPLLPFRRKLLSRFSPTSSSDIAPSLDDSIESGPLSDLQSEEEEGRRASADPRLPPAGPLLAGRGGGGASLVQRLLQDVQNQERDTDVWRTIEGLVQQLDGFISWLQEALDSTENWTQPRQDLDSLRVYLDTHLSFKLNVDSRCNLKESIMEDGRALLAIIPSHQSALKEILHMVSSQWEQLQRQIRRQHGWMLRALRCVQARLLYAGQSLAPAAAPGAAPANQQPDGLKVELISSQCEAQRAALEQMAIKLSSLQYPSPASRRPYVQLARNNSLQEFESEYQELWDWLMDMDAMVTDSHQLMMSEEQRHHLYKSSHAELMMMESRKASLLGRAESLKRSGAELPSDFHRRMHNLTHTWRQLESILSEHSGSRQPSLPSCSLRVRAAAAAAAAENPRSALSPLTNSLLEQLEARIKELKAWLRDTELLIFNSCLRQDKEAADQLLSFKSLCSEVRARRRGVASVLKLCQKLLQQSQSGPMAEVGPEAEQHREALQLLSINLERRWEAIVMQALQWQNRLKRELGEQQVPGNFLEPGLVDLHQMSPVPGALVAPPAEDSWEWDETDMTITEPEPQEALELDLTLNLPTEHNLPSDGTALPTAQCEEITFNPRDGGSSESGLRSQCVPPNNNNIYQVYSLHNVELYQQPQFPPTSFSQHKAKDGKRKLLLKSLSKDSSFSSLESLPDLLGGLMPSSRGGERAAGSRESPKEGGRRSGQSSSSLRSESESGIVSDTGDAETVVPSAEFQLEEEGQGKAPKKEHQRSKMEESRKEKGWRRKGEEEKKRRHRRGGEAVEILINGLGILTPADSDSDFEAGSTSKHFLSRCDVTELKAEQFSGLETPPLLSRRASSPALSQGSSLESLLALGVELFPSKELLHRSASLESGLAPCHSAGGETGGSLASLGDLDLAAEGGGGGGGGGEGEPGKEPARAEASSGELSRRTLDLLKRLENIQSPTAGKMTRSVSDMALLGSPPQRHRLPASPSLGGHHAPLSGISGSPRRGPPSLINESSATASLTELSSTEDSSLGSSEDLAALRNRRRLFLDPGSAANGNPSAYRKHGNGQRGQGMEEGDGTSLSMVVNVSSACTDEDEDDSDLLSSSTLTLTEEELGVRDEEEEEEERLTGVSSGNEDDEDDDEEAMEESYALGLDYMKRELQSWIRPPRTSSSSSKTEADLWDELQCGSAASPQNKEQRSFLKRSTAKPAEANANSGNNRTDRDKKDLEEENRRNATRSYISQFVDDVENGNVDQSCLKGKDEDDELLREESSVFTKKGEPLRETYAFVSTATEPNLGELIAQTESAQMSSSPSCDLLPFASVRGSSLVGQLRGELPCHSSSVPSPPSLSPVEDAAAAAHHPPSGPAAGGRKAITIQEKFKFSSIVMEESRREVRNKDSSLPPKKWRGHHASCCGGHLATATTAEGKKDNVHDFVMEIIDMTSLALKSKEAEDPNQNGTSGSNPDQNPTSSAQIRDKVLKHSHQPLHLRKGDFYSYLSLSSHDSDCGEVSQCADDKSSSPAPYAIPSYASPSPEPPAHHQTSASSSELTVLDLKTASAGGSSSGTSPPPSPDIRDEETLFAACTEEVYLGPPLCYSMALPKTPRRVSLQETLGYLEPDYVANDTLSYSKSIDALQYLSRDGMGARETPYASGSSPGPGPASASASAAKAERQGEEPTLLCDVAAGEVAASVSTPQEQWRGNERPSYLNPRARVAPIDSSAAECLADTKTLESNMGAVMTKISVGGAATNPSKEPAAAAAAAAATRINPKINCSAMREADREEGERRGEAGARRGKREAAAAAGTRGRPAPQQEARTPAKQVSSTSVTNHANRAAPKGRSQASVRPPNPRIAPVRRFAMGGASVASRVQL